MMSLFTAPLSKYPCSYIKCHYIILQVKALFVSLHFLRLYHHVEMSVTVVVFTVYVTYWSKSWCQIVNVMYLYLNINTHILDATVYTGSSGLVSQPIFLQIVPLLGNVNDGDGVTYLLYILMLIVMPLFMYLFLGIPSPIWDIGISISR